VVGSVADGGRARQPIRVLFNSFTFPDLFFRWWRPGPSSCRTSFASRHWLLAAGCYFGFVPLRRRHVVPGRYAASILIGNAEGRGGGSFYY